MTKQDSGGDTLVCPMASFIGGNGGKSEGGGSSGKAFGSIAGIVALIAGIYAMVTPMTQRIDYIQESCNTISSRLDDHNQKQAEAVSQLNARLTAIETKFLEVDVNNKSVIERVIKLEGWREYDLKQKIESANQHAPK